MNKSKEKLDRAEALLKEVRDELPGDPSKALLEEIDALKRKMYVIKLLSTLMKELTTNEAVTTHYVEHESRGLISGKNDYWAGLNGSNNYDIGFRSYTLGNITIRGVK